jgi:hypothetical protein
MNTTTVAETILQQLGGNRFLAMTGAKNLVGDDRMLQFSISGNLTKDKSNKVRITLNELDLYLVETFRLRGADFRVCSKVENVCFDMLPAVFSSITGLNTHL